MTRVGAIDLGTNATRLLVADVEDGRVDELLRRTRITRLGEGVDARRRLLPVPVARVRNVLTEYRRDLEQLGAERTLAVATSAVRDAENGEAFLGEVEWSYGFATRLLTGDEEAAMTLRGVGPLEPGTVVIDVGGGSTELITEGFRCSLDIGSVRLTERHGGDWDAAAAEIRAQLPELAGERALGVDGTTAELAALDAVTLAGIDGVLTVASRLDGRRTPGAPAPAGPQRRDRRRGADRPRGAPPPRPRPDRPFPTRPPERCGAGGCGPPRAGRRRGAPRGLYLLLRRDICVRNLIVLKYLRNQVSEEARQ